MKKETLDMLSITPEENKVMIDALRPIYYCDIIDEALNISDEEISDVAMNNLIEAIKPYLIKD